MTIWRVNNATLLGGEVCAPWQPNHVYALGARCVCRPAYATVARRAYVYECTTAGTSHATTEPVWPTSGTIVDGGVTWTTRQPNDGNWDNATCIAHYLSHSALAHDDFVYVHNAHNESTNLGAQYIIKSGIIENQPTKWICVNKADDSLSVGALIYQSLSTTQLSLLGYGYAYGITFKSAGDFTLSGSTRWTVEGAGTTTLLHLVTANKLINFQTSSSHVLRIVNGSINFENANNSIWLGTTSGNSSLEWFGGSVIAANGLTALITTSPECARVIIREIDLSGVGNGANARSLVNIGISGFIDITFERCKLPSDAGFTLTSSAFSGHMNGKVRFHHCSSENKTYDFYEVGFEGNIQDETTIVRNGGANDGTTPQSWKMVTGGTSVADNYQPWTSPPIQSWTESITEKTFTIECLVDSAINLQNDEVWMEFEYPADNSSGLGTNARDKCLILGSPADKSSSGADWVTTGMANPNAFKCQVTVTPGKAGPIRARIHLAKVSTTIYVDPLITES